MKYSWNNRFKKLISQKMISLYITTAMNLILGHWTLKLIEKTVDGHIANVSWPVVILIIGPLIGFDMVILGLFAAKVFQYIAEAITAWRKP